MATVTIFGTGTMGSAIAGILAAGGASIQHIGSDGGQTITGEIVVLAVPYPSLAVIASTYASQLEGKIVIDITNPVNFETFDSLVVPEGSSAAAQLAALLPASTVLKAFNTNLAATLSTRKLGNADTTVLVAGGDDASKKTVVDLIIAGGVKAIDAGSLKRAHELEALGFLQLTLASSEKITWTGGFAVIN
jgi:predicted dinucleotide-binding enzyme